MRFSIATKAHAYRVAFLYILFLFVQNTLAAQVHSSLRRPVSPNQPMWLIHIDTWNYADPQKIIDLVPDDIKPFVVMNISLSISHNAETSQFQVAEYGYEIARSWLRTCAQNRMWAMVQPSSGGFSQFSDFDLSVYEEFFRDYPNMLGFNYCEQFWGYDDANDPLSAKWSDRMAHFAHLLKISNHYGGYLVVSWCGNQWSPPINPMGMLKRNPNFAEACRKYTENFILCEKYTQQSYQYDMESLCLGAYLSGYSGNWGIRYDDTGWTDASGNHDNFVLSTGGAPHLEHIMLGGQTVIDAPELIWTQCFRELNPAPASGGYTERRWETFPQFDNFSIDLFRKILDGTIRIPSREEVIDRTKVVIVQDVNSGSSDEIYSTPETLFQGLYRMDGDGNYDNNKSFFKKTGRYPTIPTVFQLDDSLAQTFDVPVRASEYARRWPSLSSKQSEFNTLFPEEYTGDLYAGRHENAWVVYNPFKTGKNASASVPFRYNTCERAELTFAQYSSGVMKEYTDRLTFYLTNYDEYNARLKTDIIRIYGSSSEPAFSWTDRGQHATSVLSKTWSDGVFTLTVQHNGPLDITLTCSGGENNRLSDFTTANITTPDLPPLYTGPRQYEAECFDYRNINRNVTGGQNRNIRNYTGQGYLQFGTGSSACVRDTVEAFRSGSYWLETRYSTSGADVRSIDLYVNGVKTSSPEFAKTTSESDWNIHKQSIALNAGKNVLEYKARTSGASSINFDHIVIHQGESSRVYHFENDEASTEASDPPAEGISLWSGSAGVVIYTDAQSETTHGFRAFSIGNINQTGAAGLDLFPSAAQNYSVVWKEYSASP
ncbi:MAG TPA: glycoside hydrolase family 98 domain-containing protein, partial [Prolixibacteraceae bacterium]|nr:glycoside hydrolase family 98 domain-containing protein [Prolixibacteraceae bacterium]